MMDRYSDDEAGFELAKRDLRRVVRRAEGRPWSGRAADYMIRLGENLCASVIKPETEDGAL